MFHYTIRFRILHIDSDLSMVAEQALLTELVNWASKALATLRDQVRSLHRHELAVFVVFGLGLVQKILKVDDSKNEVRK